MGKKRVAQVMQPTESGSFLAGQVQPIAEVGEVSGIQETKKVEQIETKDIIEHLKKTFVNRVLEKINKHLDDKIRFLDDEEKIVALYKLNRLARYEADTIKALDILFSPLPDFSKKLKEI